MKGGPKSSLRPFLHRALQLMEYMCIQYCIHHYYICMAKIQSCTNFTF